MEQKEDPRAILQKLTSENLDKMREIARKIVQADQQRKTNQVKVQSKNTTPSEQRLKRNKG